MSVSNPELQGILYVDQHGAGHLVALFERSHNVDGRQSNNITAVPVNVMPSLIRPSGYEDMVRLRVLQRRGITTLALQDAWDLGAKAALQSSLGRDDLIMSKSVTDVIEYIGEINRQAEKDGARPEFRGAIWGRHRS